MNKALVLSVVGVVIIAGYLVYYNRSALFPEPVCAMQTCHGFDVTCGQQEIQCALVYQFGDNCRRFTHCQVVNGKCGTLIEDRFGQCVSCVAECSKLLETDYVKAYECEYWCWQ